MRTRTRASVPWLLAGLVAAGCGHARSEAPPPSGTIGVPSDAGYLLIDVTTATTRRARFASGSQVASVSDGHRVWRVDGHGVAVVAPDGSVERRFRLRPSTPTQGIGDVSWSPDGRSFAYTDGGGLFVVPTHSARPRRLVRAEGLYEADWSPKGDAIAFLQLDSPEAAEGRIRVVGPDGRGVRTLTHGFDPAISPSGRQLAFATFDGVFVMPFAGGRPRRVAQAGAHPEWSPDGRYLAFAQEAICTESGCTDVVVVKPGTGSVARAFGPEVLDMGELYWVS